jgi:hypothetical protein
VIALIVGGLIAVLAVVIVAWPFLHDSGEPDLIDMSADEEVLALLESRDQALAALKELEFDHRTGKIADDDYRASVGPLRRQAAEALQALDRVKAAREAAAPPSSADEDLVEQEEVQRDDHEGDAARGDSGEPPVDQIAHHVAARGEPDERDQREGDPERQHDL